MKKRVLDPYQKERDMIQQFCDYYGATVEWRLIDAPQYQLALIRGPEYSIVAYPHKTSAKNYHIRLRDQASKSPDKCREAMETLYHMAGNNCIFQPKHAESKIDTRLFHVLPQPSRRQRKLAKKAEAQ